METEEEISSVDFINNLIQTDEAQFEYPININISQTKKIFLPDLKWNNYEISPKKMIISNTGHNVLLTGQWKKELPFLTGGPFKDDYVFSQLHLHWGINDMEGSEHTIDGAYLPGEMHLIFFKSSYLKHESALKENDGIAILVYLINLQEGVNMKFQKIVECLMDIQLYNTNTRIIPPPNLSQLVDKFNSDYFMYWGWINTTNCKHNALWLINRNPMSVSIDQIDFLRHLLNQEGQQIVNSRKEFKLLKQQVVFHVNPSDSEFSTLLLKK